jgi:hypothetical protein
MTGKKFCHEPRDNKEVFAFGIHSKVTPHQSQSVWNLCSIVYPMIDAPDNGILLAQAQRQRSPAGAAGRQWWFTPVQHVLILCNPYKKQHGVLFPEFWGYQLHLSKTKKLS